MRGNWFLGGLIGCATLMTACAGCYALVALWSGKPALVEVSVDATEAVDAAPAHAATATVVAPPTLSPLSESPVPTSSPTPIPLRARLSALEGVRQVRVIDITAFEAGRVALLEVDVLGGYVNTAMANTIHAETLAHMGAEPNAVEFSLILWDRRLPAINYTWNTRSGEWLTTHLQNAPG